MPQDHCLKITVHGRAFNLLETPDIDSRIDSRKALRFERATPAQPSKRGGRPMGDGAEIPIETQDHRLKMIDSRSACNLKNIASRIASRPFGNSRCGLKITDTLDTDALHHNSVLGEVETMPGKLSPMGRCPETQYGPHRGIILREPQEHCL